MADKNPKNPLPPCPDIPNCVRTSRSFKAGPEKVFEAISQIFEQESHTFEVLNHKRIEIHAVYRIPLFGFKDDVDVIMEEAEEQTTVFIRSSSRVGSFDLGVNKRRVSRIFRKLKSRI